MRTAFQIDPPHTLTPRSDTSMMLAAEGQKRGIETWWYAPSDLYCLNGVVRAQMQHLTLHEGTEPWFSIGEQRDMALSEIDLIWMRQDPPFDIHYITATHLLERAGTKVVNNPAGVRNAPEKLSPLAFARYMPPTLISSQAAPVADFVREHGTVIAKPLYGYGGRSVFKFAATDGNLDTFLEFWRESSGGEPLMWQRFLPEVKSEDRRLLLINGELASCFGRTPEHGSIRANMRVGGEAVAADITPRQRDIAEAVGEMARAQGLLLVGLDVIGDYLTEINVTSPTGLRAAEKLYGVDLSVTVWDAALAA